MFSSSLQPSQSGWHDRCYRLKLEVREVTDLPQARIGMKGLRKGPLRLSTAPMCLIGLDNKFWSGPPGVTGEWSEAPRVHARQCTPRATGFTRAEAVRNNRCDSGCSKREAKPAPNTSTKHPSMESVSTSWTALLRPLAKTL
jgi:hypothetical protein